MDEIDFCPRLSRMRSMRTATQLALAHGFGVAGANGWDRLLMDEIDIFGTFFSFLRNAAQRARRPGRREETTTWRVDILRALVPSLGV